MRHILSVQFLTLCFAAVFSLANPVAAQSLPDSTTGSRTVTWYGPEYLRGQEAARTNAHFPGTFATGFVFGAALPYVIGGSYAGAFRLAGDSGFLGVTAGFSSGVLWTWSGSRLVNRFEIRIPERYHSELDEQTRINFDAGYTDTAREKRASRYGIGVATGIATSVAAAMAVLTVVFSEMGED